MNIEYRDGGSWGKWAWPANDRGAWHWLLDQATLPSKILPHVTNFDTCIHAGAHCGFYAKQYAALFKRLYAIEPQGQNFYCLTQNVTEVNVVKLQACLSNVRQLVSLYTDDYTNSGGYYVTPGEDFLCIKMDDLVGNVGLIHLDVEGHEEFALRGGEQILEKYSPVVVMETIPNYDFRPAEEYLFHFGYSVAEILQHDRIYTNTTR